MIIVLLASTANAATFVKFQDAVEQILTGKHDFTASGHVLKIYLANAAPDVALDAVKGDLAEITAEFGYSAGGCDVQNTLSEVTGTVTIASTDCVFTASGGSFGPFRYAVLYNSTQTTPLYPLIGYWDYGSGISVTDGNTFTIDFGASLMTLQ
jgi:hypothetical protein